MQRRNIYLSKEQLEALKRISEHREQPVAQLVRQAVDQWLGSQKVRPISDGEWQARFGKLLARRTQLAREHGWTDEEVERDVTAAIRVVRRVAPRRGG